MRILLTGAAGFSGSHICEEIIKRTDWQILALDRLTYAGRLDRLAHLPRERIEFFHHDFRSTFPDWLLKKLGIVDFIVHAGAETHVDRALCCPEPFIQSNVVGTFQLLEAARKLQPQRFIYVSTDEVYGPAPPNYSYVETDPCFPSNPYSASKAAGESLVYSYWKSFHVPIVISRTMNLFGERQHSEKFIPMTLKKVLANEMVQIHSSKDGEPGSRKWLHARNQAGALLFLLEHGEIGEFYNVAGEERNNLEVAVEIACLAGQKLNCEPVDVHSQRPGHDLRYSIDDTKLRNIGWTPHLTFSESLKKTIHWTLEHPEWLES